MTSGVNPHRARLGVRARIGLAFSGLGMVLFGLIGALSAHEARQQSERETSAALQQLADRLAQRLDADMAARYREVAQLAAMHELLAPDLDPQRWRVVLEQLQASLRHYSWIGLAGADGRVLAATGGLLQGRHVAQRPWFSQGLQRPVVGDVHEAVLLASLLPHDAPGEPMRFVDAAAPLRHDGQVVGVIGAHLTWRWAEARRAEALALVAPGRQAEIVLVDRAGAIVLGPAQPTLPAGEPAASAGLRNWSDGTAYLTASSSSRASDDYPGMGWTVVVRQPVHTAFAEANALQLRLWALGTLGALLFGAGGWWLAGRLTQPLRDVARRAAAMAAAGHVQLLMKGSLHTDELMQAVLAEPALRTGRRMSHVFRFEVPAYPRPLLVTDAALNIRPTLEEKADIVRNAIDVAQALGVARPRVALLSAVETVTARLVSTLDAAALCKMADRGQITGALLDGPLAFDNAISAAAAQVKGIVSPVAGQADVLVVPDLESGNMLAKQLEYLAGASSCGVVVGCRVPVALTSRSDSPASRQASAALAVRMAHAAGRAGS